MSEKLEVAMSMLDEAAMEVEDVDVIFNIRNAQQLLQYELDGVTPTQEPEPGHRCGNP